MPAGVAATSRRRTRSPPIGRCHPKSDDESSAPVLPLSSSRISTLRGRWRSDSESRLSVRRVGVTAFWWAAGGILRCRAARRAVGPPSGASVRGRGSFCHRWLTPVSGPQGLAGDELNTWCAQSPRTHADGGVKRTDRSGDPLPPLPTRASAPAAPDLHDGSARCPPR